MAVLMVISFLHIASNWVAAQMISTQSNCSPWRKTILSTALCTVCVSSLLDSDQASPGQPNGALCSSLPSDSWWERHGKQGGLPGWTQERKPVLTVRRREELVSVHAVDRIPLSHQIFFEYVKRTCCLGTWSEIRSHSYLYTQGCSTQKTVLEIPAQTHMSNTTSTIIVQLCRRSSKSSDFTCKEAVKGSFNEISEAVRGPVPPWLFST